MLKTNDKDGGGSYSHGGTAAGCDWLANAIISCKLLSRHLTSREIFCRVREKYAVFWGAEMALGPGTGLQIRKSNYSLLAYII
jgi:hypothetical protein